MAKRTSIESEQQPAGKEIRLPADSTIKTFNSAFCEAQETVDGANEQLKDAADIAKKRHLNVWAFKICQKLYDDVKNAKNEALASEKLAVKLAQLDKIRKYFKLDELANLQGRMFAEGEIGAKGGCDVIVVDAFSGDSIPVHLLTREALAHLVTSKRIRDLDVSADIVGRALVRRVSYRVGAKREAVELRTTIGG